MSQLRFFLAFGLSAFIYPSFSQCLCDNCPVDTPAGVPVSATITISGAVNDELNGTSQRVCKVLIDMDHEAIREMYIELVAPDGSAVDLMINNGAEFGPNDFWDVCFLPCDEPVFPDNDYSDNWTAEEFDQGGGPYDGSYYPSNGCLEQDLSGPVNGVWTLNMEDNVILFDGTLNTWEIVFADGTGIDCQVGDGCAFEPVCDADGGTLSGVNDDYCEGDPALDFNWTVSYSGDEPDPALYGYQYVISENNVIIAYADTPDLSGYGPGDYVVCGMSYLLADEPLIPDPNGSISTSDLLDDIEDGLYCADLTLMCRLINIDPVPDPVLTGPLVVCAGEEVMYTNDNYNEDAEYLWQLVSGSFGLFILNPESSEATVIWNAGPGEICLIEQSPGCGDITVCVEVMVIEAPEFSILTPDPQCADSDAVYTFDPPLDDPSELTVTVTNGTLVDITSTDMTIMWDPDVSSGDICWIYDSDDCPPTEEQCISVDLDDTIDDFSLGAVLTVCVGTTIAYVGPNDPDITEYNWSVTNGEIIAEIANTASVNFEEGVGEICLSVVNQCGEGETVCLEAIVNPEPEVIFDPDFIETCNLTTTVSGDIGDSDGVVSWSLGDVDGTVDFDDLTSPTTDVTFSNEGSYELILTVFEGLCEGSDTITVEVVDGIYLDNIAIVCDEDFNYTISFDVINAVEPIVVNGTAITGSSFTSEDIASGDSYLFEVIDEAGCQTMIEGLNICPCITDAGTMLDESFSICLPFDEAVTGTHNNDETFDANDAGVYVLHTSATDVLGTIIEINTTGSFSFDPGTMVPGTSYYISFVVGNDDGAGGVDVSDDCLSVAEGVEVVFYETPEAMTIDDIGACYQELDLSFIGTPTGGDWSIIDLPDNSDADISGNPLTLFMDEVGWYSLAYEVEENGCSDADTLNINYVGFINIADLEVLCDGLFYTVSFTIVDGIEPYTVNGESIDGNTFISDPIPSGDNYSFIVQDAVTCLSEPIEGTKACNCESDAGTMPPEVIEICPDIGTVFSSLSNGDATLDPDDIGLYILHDSPSSILGSVIEISNDGSFSYDPLWGEDVRLYISYAVGNGVSQLIDFNDPCFSVSEGTPVDILSYPDLSLSLIQEFCSFNFTVLNVGEEVNGEWRFIMQPENSTIQDLDTFGVNTSFSVSDPGLYTLVFSTIDETCSSSDTFPFSVFPFAQFDTVDYVCNQSKDSFETIIFFELFGDSLFYEQDTFVESPIVLGPFASGIDTTINVISQLGCPTEVPITFTCDCENEPLVISLSDKVLCETDSFFVDVLDGLSLESDELFRLLISSDTSTIFSSEVNSLDELVISATSPLDSGDPYFCTLLIGQENNGELDVDDPCLRISNSVEFSFDAMPMFDLVAPEDVCGVTAILMSTEDGNWTSSELNPSTGVSILSSGVNESEVTVEEAGLYTFIFEAVNGECSARDSLSLSFVDSLSASANITCLEEGYSIALHIEGGTGNYSVNGEAIVGDVFSETVMGFDSSRSFTISDDGLCPSIELTIDIPCDCESAAPDIINESWLLCETDSLFVDDLFLSNAILGPNDDVRYFLHTGIDLTLTNSISEIDDLIIFDSANLIAGQVYYITAVVGLFSGPELFDDLCTVFSLPVALIWEEPERVTLLGGGSYCSIDSFTLAIEYSGMEDIEVVLYSTSGPIETLLVPSGGLTITLDARETDQYFLQNLVGDCVELALDTVDVIVNEPYDLSFVDEIRLCNDPTFGSVISLDSLFIGAIAEGDWRFEGESINDVFDATNVAPGNYILRFEIQEDNCPEQIYAIDVNIEECDCPQVTTYSIDVCNTETMIPISAIIESDVQGELSLLSWPGTEPSAWLQNDEIVLEGLAAGTYTFGFDIITEYPDVCQENYTASITVFIYQAILGVQDSYEFCSGDEMSISLLDFVENPAIGQFFTSEGVLIEGSFIESASLDLGLNEFAFIGNNNGPCPVDTFSFDILQNRFEGVSANVIDVRCFGENDGSIELTFPNEAASESALSFVNGESLDDHFYEDLAPGEYTIEVIDGNGCDTSFLLQIEEPELLTVTLGDDLVLDRNESATIEALINILAADVSEIEWSELEAILSENGLLLERTFSENTSISIEIVDVNGCEARDEIMIIIEESILFVPNVFSPSASAPNDVFSIGNLDSVDEVLQFSIYDRWGNAIVSLDRPAAVDVRWDGTFNDIPVVQGVYVFTLEYERGAERISLVGDITVLR